jgi:hypothetical protein
MQATETAKNPVSLIVLDAQAVSRCRVRRYQQVLLLTNMRQATHPTTIYSLNKLLRI